MESSPHFFRIRAITFTCIMLFSFLWLVLLCVEIFTRWSISDQISRSLMIVFTLANTATLIMLPILILVQFRVWLDTARLFFLFVLHVGSAIAGSVWIPRIQCPHQTLDDLGVCQLIGVYTVIAFWTIPAILICYSTYFAVVVYLQSCIPVVVEPDLRKRRLGIDLEMGSTDSLSSWNEKLKEIVGMRASTTNMNVPPRQLVLPALVQARQSQGQSTSPNAPRRQSAMPQPRTDHGSIPTLPSATSRHHSLPAFKHGDDPHRCPLLISSMPRLLAINPSSSYPQISFSRSYPVPPSANPQTTWFTSQPSDADVQPESRRWISKHLSMMPSPSSPRNIQDADGSPRPAKLTKPLPVHLM